LRFLTALLSTLVVACSSHPTPQASGSVTATARDFRMWLGSATTAAGPTTFVLHSRGPSSHEFAIARTDLPPAALPLGADGLTVDEGSPQLSKVRRLAGIDAGQTLTVVATLAPGNYVIFCNYEGHYLGGMHVGLRVDASSA
jgi:uncharacterized cupredoxin-like copper-binding protein